METKKSEKLRELTTFLKMLEEDKRKVEVARNALLKFLPELTQARTLLSTCQTIYYDHLIFLRRKNKDTLSDRFKKFEGNINSLRILTEKLTDVFSPSIEELRAFKANVVSKINVLGETQRRIESAKTEEDLNDISLGVPYPLISSPSPDTDRIESEWKQLGVLGKVKDCLKNLRGVVYEEKTAFQLEFMEKKKRDKLNELSTLIGMFREDEQKAEVAQSAVSKIHSELTEAKRLLSVYQTTYSDHLMFLRRNNIDTPSDRFKIFEGPINIWCKLTENFTMMHSTLFDEWDAFHADVASKITLLGETLTRIESAKTESDLNDISFVAPFQLTSSPPPGPDTMESQWEEMGILDNVKEWLGNLRIVVDEEKTACLLETKRSEKLRELNNLVEMLKDDERKAELAQNAVLKILPHISMASNQLSTSLTIYINHLTFLVGRNKDTSSERLKEIQSSIFNLQGETVRLQKRYSSLFNNLRAFQADAVSKINLLGETQPRIKSAKTEADLNEISFGAPYPLISSASPNADDIESEWKLLGFLDKVNDCLGKLQVVVDDDISVLEFIDTKKTEKLKELNTLIGMLREEKRKAKVAQDVVSEFLSQLTEAQTLVSICQTTYDDNVNFFRGRNKDAPSEKFKGYEDQINTLRLETDKVKERFSSSLDEFRALHADVVSKLIVLEEMQARIDSAQTEAALNDISFGAPYPLISNSPPDANEIEKEWKVKGILDKVKDCLGNLQGVVDEEQTAFQLESMETKKWDKVKELSTLIRMLREDEQKAELAQSAILKIDPELTEAKSLLTTCRTTYDDHLIFLRRNNIDAPSDRFKIFEAPINTLCKLTENFTTIHSTLFDAWDAFHADVISKITALGETQTKIESAETEADLNDISFGAPYPLISSHPLDADTIESEWKEVDILKTVKVYMGNLRIVVDAEKTACLLETKRSEKQNVLNSLLEMLKEDERKAEVAQNAVLKILSENTEATNLLLTGRTIYNDHMKFLLSKNKDTLSRRFKRYESKLCKLDRQRENFEDGFSSLLIKLRIFQEDAVSKINVLGEIQRRIENAKTEADLNEISFGAPYPLNSSPPPSADKIDREWKLQGFLDEVKDFLGYVQGVIDEEKKQSLQSMETKKEDKVKEGGTLIGMLKEDVKKVEAAGNVVSKLLPQIFEAQSLLSTCQTIYDEHLTFLRSLNIETFSKKLKAYQGTIDNLRKETNNLSERYSSLLEQFHFFFEDTTSKLHWILETQPRILSAETEADLNDISFGAPYPLILNPPPDVGKIQKNWKQVGIPDRVKECLGKLRSLADTAKAQELVKVMKRKRSEKMEEHNILIGMLREDEKKAEVAQNAILKILSELSETETLLVTCKTTYDDHMNLLRGSNKFSPNARHKAFQTVINTLRQYAESFALAFSSMLKVLRIMQADVVSKIDALKKTKKDIEEAKTEADLNDISFGAPYPLTSSPPQSPDEIESEWKKTDLLGKTKDFLENLRGVVENEKAELAGI